MPPPGLNAFLQETEPSVLKELVRSLHGLRLEPEAVAHLLQLLESARTTPAVTLPLRPAPDEPHSGPTRGGFIGLIQRSLKKPPASKTSVEICRWEKSTLDDLFGIVGEVVQVLGTCANQQSEIFAALLLLSRVDIRPWNTLSKVAEALARRAVSSEEQGAVLSLLSEWIGELEPQRVQFPAMSLAAAAPANFAVQTLQQLLLAGHDLDTNWSVLLTDWPTEVITQVAQLLRSSADPVRLRLLRVCRNAAGRLLSEAPFGLVACLTSPDAEVVRFTCQTLASLAGEPRSWQDVAPALHSAWRHWTTMEGSVSDEIESLWGRVGLALPEEVVASLSARSQATMVRPNRIEEVVLEATFSAPFDPQRQPWRSYLAQCSAASGGEALYLLAPPRLYYFPSGRESQSWPLPAHSQRKTCSLLWRGDQGDIFCTLGIFGQVQLGHLASQGGHWTLLTPPIPYEGLSQAPLRRLSAGRFAWTDGQRAYHIDVSAGTIEEAAVETVVPLPSMAPLVALDMRSLVKDWRWNPLSGERDSASTSLLLPRGPEAPLLTRVTYREGRAVGLEVFPERRLIVYGWG